jgi:transcriptional regulator with XRE-family HTH domain
MEDSASVLNQRIAARVRQLRAAAGLTLDALAGRSGVSRSMISLVERGESSPPGVLLEKLAAGLGVVLASLFDAPAAAGARSAPPPDVTNSRSGRTPPPGTCGAMCHPRGGG